MQRKALRTLASICVICAVTVCAGDLRAAEMSVWYRFESDATLGHSVGENVWPAYPLRAKVGPGKFGKGLALEGAGGNGLYLPNPVSFFGPEARSGTIAFWVKPAFDAGEEKGQRCLLDFMKDAGNTLIDGYEIVIFTDGPKLKAKPQLLRQMEIPSPLRKGEWTHLTLAWDCREGTSLYVNGEKKAEIAAAFEPTSLEKGWPGRVGCHTSGGGFPFAGTIDELRLFNHRLSDEEVRTVANTEPRSLELTVAGDWFTSIQVRNRSNATLPVSLQAWLPGLHAAPPFVGYLPFGFGDASPTSLYWTAGATPVERLSEPVSLRPGEQRKFAISRQPVYLHRRNYRLLAGSGISAIEIAAQQHNGLSIEPTMFRPLVYADGRPLAVQARAENDLGRAFSGTVRAELTSTAGGIVDQCSTLLQLSQRQQRQIAFRFHARLPVGSYRLRLIATEQGKSTVVNHLPLYVTKDDTYRTIHDVAAAYVSPVEDPKVLAAMAKDGVVALRMHGKYGDYYSSEKNLSALMQYGFKVTRMGIAGYSACRDESRHDSLRQMARNLGLYLKDNPAVLNQVIAGEGLSAPPCYCDKCNQSFRDYMRRTHKTLDALNAAWETSFKDWSEVQQLGSPQDIDETAERLKIMKVALELPADNTARWRKLFELNKAKAMEWKRWHEEGLLDWYTDFAETFKATNGGRTSVGEQPCWPNFESHILFALGQIADMGGMDLYLPGEMPTSLGYAAELFLNFDLNASIFHANGKPVMVHELYVQDNSPSLLPEAQGWWLVGRGYGALTYFTYDYYYEGIRANLPLIFGLFDKEGKPFSSYPSFTRFSRDYKEFHKRYNCNSLRREQPRVALFMGDDVSLANNLETGGATWEASAVHGHNGAYWLTERSGLPMEFVNDDSFDRLAGKKALIVPWCHVIRPSTIDRIVGFARKGGTVLLDGAVGLYDENYRAYGSLPGGRLSEALGVDFKGYEDRPNSIVVKEEVELPSQGVAVEPRITKGTVLLKDARGRPALVEILVGKGKALFFLTNLGRRNLERVPDNNAVTLWKSLLEKRAGMETRYSFTSTSNGNNPKNLFDVSVRIKGGDELFLFMVSFFEPSEGAFDLHLPSGDYTAFDALTGERTPLSRSKGHWQLKISLPASGSKVIRIKAAQGRPFAAW
ncbi:MAG: beta-galactosidase [Armatimonadetes bacterium]|nr:beta-galactosidase [Armatimonadota bacterium]